MSRDWYDSWPVVARGIWLYDGTAQKVVEIARSDTRFGSHDDDDPPEDREDLQIDTFYIAYRDTQGRFLAGGGGFPSVALAKEHARHLLGQSVQWEDFVA